MFSPHSRAPFRSHLRIPVRSLFQRSPSNASNKTYGIHSPKKACKSNSSTLLGQRLRGNPKWFTCNQSHKPWLPKVIMGSTSTTPEKFEFAFIWHYLWHDFQAMTTSQQVFWRILLAVFHKPRSWRVFRSKPVVRCRKWHWNRRSMWTTVPWNRGV